MEAQFENLEHIGTQCFLPPWSRTSGRTGSSLSAAGVYYRGIGLTRAVSIAVKGRDRYGMPNHTINIMSLNCETGKAVS